MKEIVRRINFFTAAFVGVVGLSLASEIIMENDVPDKIDDILMVILSLVAIYWYKKSGYKANKTFVSVLLLLGAIAIKIMAVVIEHADKEAVGDDYGVLAALIIAIIFVLWQSISSKTLN